jgi:ribose transport system substrate-binding protein
MGYRRPLTLILLVPLVLMSALSQSGEARDVRIGLSWDARESALNRAWEDYLKSEATTQGARLGIHVKWVVNMAENDASRQAANIEDLLNSGVDIILARPLDAAAIGASIRRARQSNIPLVTFDRASSGVQPTAHVGGDSADQARVVGAAFEQLLAARQVKGACIELQGSLADINAINRIEAWRVLGEHSRFLHIVARVPTEWDPQRVLSGLSDALRAHSEANCVMAASDWAIDAVQSVLQKSDRWYPTGQPRHMWIASCDLLTGAVTAMERGYIDVSVTWDAHRQAREAVRVLLAIVTGRDPGCPSRTCLVKGQLVTPDNVRQMPDYWARKYH